MAKPALNCWQPGYVACYDEPWFQGLSLETQRRYKEQDLARAEAHRQWLRAVSQDERKEAARAFVDLCRTQAATNLSGPPHKPASDPVSDVRRELGITATPSYEDPEALRRGRVELGLDEDVFVETNAAPGGSR
jgi:hypothetical protein